MNGWKRILVPVDGSEISKWVITRAKRLLEPPDASVTLLTVIPADPEHAADFGFRVDFPHRPVQEALFALRDELRARSVAAEAKIGFGNPGVEILREIAAGHYDVVLMATHARTGLDRLLFGSVALRVLQASPVPLMLFHPLLRADGTLSPAEFAEPARFLRILVPLDGSETAEEILPFVEAMARPFGSRIHLLTAIPGGVEQSCRRRVAEEYLRKVEHLLEENRVQASHEVSVGPAAGEALECIRRHELDAVAMTTHGRTGAAHALYGSVAERILRDSNVPVLTLRNWRIP